jgi:hypothetical protein
MSHHSSIIGSQTQTRVPNHTLYSPFLRTTFDQRRHRALYIGNRVLFGLQSRVSKSQDHQMERKKDIWRRCQPTRNQLLHYFTLPGSPGPLGIVFVIPSYIKEFIIWNRTARALDIPIWHSAVARSSGGFFPPFRLGRCSKWNHMPFVVHYFWPEPYGAL